MQSDVSQVDAVVEGSSFLIRNMEAQLTKPHIFSNGDNAFHETYSIFPKEEVCSGVLK